MKKSLKKIMALTLTCLLLFSITACAKKKSAKEVMESSIEQSQKMKDFDMSGNMNYKIESGESDSETGSSIELGMKFDAKAKMSDEDKIQMSMQSTTNMLGQSIKVNVYYTDGYYYMESSGQKMKMKMDIEELQKQIQSTTGKTSLPIKYYTDLKLEEKDSQMTIQYSLNKDGLNKYLEEIMSQMSSLSNTASADEVKVTSFSGTRTVNEDYMPVKENIKMVMESNQKEAGKVSVDMTVTYKNPGKEVKVTLPNDLSSYQEISSQTGQTSN